MPKKKLALVGFAPTNRDLAPWDNKEYEIWTLNQAPHHEWMKRFDVLFDLHPMSHLKRERSPADKQHLEWLKQEHGDLIIYMQEEYPEVPNAKRFPIERMKKKFGNFYTSSFAYMMALAIDKGYKRIDVFGFDMDADAEYNYQKDSAEYFIGLAIGMGIDVGIPENSSLLTGTIYAFSDNTVGFRQKMEMRGHSLKHQLDSAIGDFNVLCGYTAQLKELLKDYPKLQELYKQKMKEKEKQRDVSQSIYGAMLECQEMLKLYDDYYNIIGRIKAEAEEDEQGTETDRSGTKRNTKQASKS